MFLRVVNKLIEAGYHFGLKTLVDLGFRPKIAHAVLHPFKVRNRDAAGIGKDVWNNEYSVVMQDLIGLGRCWPVGALGKYFAFDTPGVLRRDLVFGGTRR